MWLGKNQAKRRCAMDNTRETLHDCLVQMLIQRHSLYNVIIDVWGLPFYTELSHLNMQKRYSLYYFNDYV